MDLRTLTAYGVKIAGLIVAVTSLTRLSAVMSLPLTTGRPEVFTVMLGYMIPTAIPLVIGLSLWLFPGKIANTLLLPENSAQTIEGETPQIMRAAIAVLGLYLLASALYELAQSIAFLYQTRELVHRSDVLPPRIVSRIVGASIELAIGLVFALGAKGIAAGLRRFWALGRTWP